MHANSVIAELLESACPSIRHRLRSEIQGQPPTGIERLALQDQILQDPSVQEVLGWQQPDGWLAWNFHGTISTETGIRLLYEKGLDRRHPVLKRALEALEKYPERLERGIGEAGRILDETGFGGSQMIRATLFAYAGQEDKPCVQAQVSEALAGFQAIQEVDSIRAIVEEYKGRLVFKPGVRWPSIYHLRLLAITQKWRIAKNQARLVEAFKRLVELSPLPDIYVRFKSRWIAPASFCMHQFNPQMESMKPTEWMQWFHRLECLARLGVVRKVPELMKQMQWLEDQCKAEGGWFTLPLRHPYFTKWGAYTGLQLEPDWRHPKKRIYDLTFRSLLILHYYGS